MSDENSGIVGEGPGLVGEGVVVEV